jgi:hypothetical protein
MTGKKYLKTYKRISKPSNHIKCLMLKTGETEKAYSFERFTKEKKETWIPKSVCIIIRDRELKGETWTELAIEKWFYKQEKTKIKLAEYQKKYQ